MSREAAIEAIQDVLFEARYPTSYRTELQDLATLIVDAAAPHLLEPVGYVVEDASYGVVSVYSDHELSDAQREARETRGRVLALVLVPKP